jgi:dihydrofolate reductase
MALRQSLYKHATFVFSFAIVAYSPPEAVQVLAQTHIAANWPTLGSIMRKLIICNIISVDGQVSGPGDSVGAMPFDDGFSLYNVELLRNSDTMLLGRKSFEEFLAYWPSIADNEAQPPVEREISRLNTAIDKVVISDSMTDADTGNFGRVKVVRRPDAYEEVIALKQTNGKGILTFGSHTMWNDLLAHGLVDELHLLVGPGLVGNGVRGFENQPPRALELLETRQLPNSNLVLLRYAPK